MNDCLLSRARQILLPVVLLFLFLYAMARAQERAAPTSSKPTKIISHGRYALATYADGSMKMIPSPLAPARDESKRIIRLTDKDLEGKGVSLPFLFDPLTFPLPVILARVNGSEPMLFIVDTGTGPSALLSPWAVKKLNLKYGEATADSADVTKPMREVKVDALDLLDADGDNAAHVPAGGGYVYEAPAEFDMDDLTGLHVAGILGFTLFDETVVQLDYADCELRVLNDANYVPPSGKGVTTLPFRLEGGSPTVIGGLPGGVSTDFLLDSGSNMTHLTCSVADRTISMATSGGEDLSDFTDFKGAHQKVGTLYQVLDAITLGALSLHRVPVSARLEAGTKNLFGNDILSLFLVTFDLPHKHVTLEPFSNEAVITAHMSGTTVVGLERRPDGTFASVEDGPQGSLKRGDVIETVDGRPLEGLTLEGAQRLLNGFADTRATVTGRRQGEIFTTILKCERPSWAKPIEPGHGNIQMSEGKDRADGPFVASADWIMTNRNKKTGLLERHVLLTKGDQILEVNGNPTGPMKDLNDFQKALGKPPLTFKVLRVGEAKPRRYRIDLKNESDPRVMASSARPRGTEYGTGLRRGQTPVR
jgi:hypothetical protein